MNRYRSGLFVNCILALVFFLSISGTAYGKNEVKINGYVIDVKGQEPAVPQDLEPASDVRHKIKSMPTGSIMQSDKDKKQIGKDQNPAAPEDVEPQDDVKYKKWIVQFTGPIHEEQKKTLIDLGCRIGDYLPDFVFIVTMNNKIKAQVEQLSFIHGMVRYKPAYKIHQKLKDESGAVRVEAGKKIKLHIRVDGVENQSLVLSEVHKKKGKVLDVRGDVVRVEVEQKHIAQFAQIEEVLWIEEAVDMKLLNDTSKWVIQTYIPNNTKIWEKGLHGEGQIVGIGDTGLDYDMPWFYDPSGTAIGPGHRKIVGYDVTYGDDYDGTFGHGTHVAGTVGGDQAPVTGQNMANGMAPKARLFMQDLTPGEEPYVFVPADLGDMFITAYNGGARIHTNSWGAALNSYDTFAQSTDRFMWTHPDFLVLFANGNSGPRTGTVGTPANAKNVISVGATENGESAENVAWFSSNGPTGDGRIKPTVAAPGVYVVSADSDGIKNSFNNGTISYSGTSMATPAVAGAAALVRQYYLDGYLPSGTANAADSMEPSAALIKATLINSAQNMTGNYTVAPIPSTGQGWGRINLSNTLTFQGDAKTQEIVDYPTGLNTADEWSRQYYVMADQPFKVTLVWTDYPGFPVCHVTLVNDLDLTVTAPDGTVYYGNVFGNGVSASGGNADRLNVEEQVLITNPLKGPYTVRVNAFNVPVGPQPFALVTTGATHVTSKGFVILNKKRYNGSGIVTITVADRDLNLRSDAAEDLTVTINSNTEPGGESVRLVETGPDTAVFSASVPIAIGATVANNGVLEAAGGDTVTISYQDANDGTGVPAIVTASATIDLTPPLISSVAASTIGDTYATVTWVTDEPADSTVNYGETTARGIRLSEAHLRTEHATLNLMNLKEATAYHFDVSSTDEAGNSATDDNGGSFYIFTTLSLPPNVTVYSSGWTQTYYDTTVIYGTALDPSGVASITVNGTPASYRASDGYYELSVNLNFGANLFTVAAADSLGNTKEMTITVTRLHPSDLVMTAVSGPTQGDAGQIISVTNTVSNIGLGDPDRFLVGLYLSTDNIITKDDILIGDRKVTYLPAGSSSSATTDCMIPSNLAPGTYYIGAIADYYEWYDQYESDENNNSLAGNQIRIEIGDLAMTAVFGVPAGGLTGQTITVTNTVTNISGISTPQGVLVQIFLSEDPVITTSDMFLGYRTVPGLAPGASSTDATAVVIPATIPSGTYYIGSIVDPYDGLRETDETNNVLRADNAVSITGPDIVMVSVSGPINARSGDIIAVSDTVAAASAGGTAPNFFVGLYLSQDNIITTADVLIGLRELPNGLAPGASSTGTTVVRIPDFVPSGTYYLGAVADNLSVQVGLDAWQYDNAKETDETNNAVAGTRITILGPDLSVTQVSGPASARTGSKIVISNTITASAAGGAAPESTAAIYLSADPVITSSDIYVGSRKVPSLNPGASSTEETKLTIRAEIAPGTYYVGAISDYNNQVTEFDETNNALAGNQITITGPDLFMSSVSGPASAMSGVPLSVSNTVTASAANGGAPSFWVGIYLSEDNVISASDRQVGSRWLSGLATGEVSTDATTVTIPNNVPPGTYYIGAIADYDNKVTETDETNNASAGNQIIVVGPDLTMSAVSGPSSGRTGTVITVNNTVTANASGGGAANFSVGIYLSPDPVISTSDILIGGRSVWDLAPGASNTDNTVVTIPAGIAGGTYYIGAIADNENRVIETDKTNNALSGNQIAITGPDLFMTAVSGPTSGSRGQIITVRNTVTASAAGGAAPSFYVGIFLSADPVITESDILIGTRYIYSLSPGETSTADTIATVPAKLTPGVYYVGVIADNFMIPCFECDPTGNLVPESDETNNALAGNQIIIIPDLTMTAVSGPASGLTGGTITVSNTVTASATGSSASGFTVGIYLSSDNIITKQDRLLASRYVSSLAAGASSAADTVVTLPSNLTPGNYYIGAIADMSNSVTESNEDNNALAGNPITVIGPDLAMTAVSGPASGISGGSITVNNTVGANAAGGSSPGFYVGIYLSTDNVITTSDILIDSRYVSGLASGASSSADTAVTIPAVAPGTYYIGAIADYTDGVAESDETNNALGSQIVVTGPDLAISAVSGPGAAVKGGTITVSNTVTNSSAVASPGFSVGLYLSADSVITTDDIFLGNRSVAGLAPGASDAAASVVTIPVILGEDDEGYQIPLAPGTYYLGAIADSGMQIGEPNETNNALAGNQVVITGP